MRRCSEDVRGAIGYECDIALANIEERARQAYETGRLQLLPPIQDEVRVLRQRIERARELLAEIAKKECTNKERTQP